MASPIPLIDTRGIFSAKTPYTLRDNVIYELSEIRDFTGLRAAGVDIYRTYYQPFNLETSVFEADDLANEVILTLTSDTLAPVYLPSSYLQSFPDTNTIPYSHVVISASLGVLPDSMDLAFLQDQIAATISGVIGVVDPTVYINTVPSDGAVSVDQHLLLETARQAQITVDVTDHAMLRVYQDQNERLREQNDALVKILQANNLIPE